MVLVAWKSSHQLLLPPSEAGIRMPLVPPPTYHIWLLKKFKPVTRELLRPLKVMACGLPGKFDLFSCSPIYLYHRSPFPFSVPTPWPLIVILSPLTMNAVDWFWYPTSRELSSQYRRSVLH